MYEDSDDEYNSDNDPKLLNYKKQQQDSDSEVEVYGVHSNEELSDNENDQSDIAISDVEGQEEDDLPDSRAWGKQKKKFYGTDYVDADYGGFQGKDAQDAEIEQEEAKELQNQLMQQLDSIGIDDIFNKKPEDDFKADTQELLKTDLSKLTSKQKLIKLRKESPELFVLIDDFKTKIHIINEYINPMLQNIEIGSIKDCEAIQFIQIYYRLILNYTTNIYMYLLLKMKNKLKNHPISKRLYQYRQLLAQIEPVFEEIIKPQINLFLEMESEKKAKEKDAELNKKKTLKILSKLQKDKLKSMKTRTASESDEQQNKKVKFADETNLNESDNEIAENDTEENGELESSIDKRPITYKIAKNKGLTPHRKKEFRNPRVKHRIKFKKALIRRKGAIREPRTELSRYSGEISGIKATVSKSIKLKS